MLHSPDLYLGTFLVLSGFALSLLNLRRIVKKTERNISAVLLSENIILSCIGVAFIVRDVYEIGSTNMDMLTMESRSGEVMKTENNSCDFKMVLMSFGPLIISLVNSFLSLMIDNYMHYRMIQDAKIKDEENTVQELGQFSSVERKIQVQKCFTFWKKYFSYIAIVLQWVVPVLMVVSMYLMKIEEKVLPLTQLRNIDNSCMAMLEMRNNTCYFDASNVTLELRQHVPLNNYFVVYENDFRHQNNTPRIDSVIKSVFSIVTNLNMSKSTDEPDYSLIRNPKSLKCLKMCFIENKGLLIYMFLLAVVSYFVPITVSTVILTKIHLVDLKKPNIKRYVSRELLYNILFWTPVMFDTFMSLLLCSYSMNAARTSLFTVVANVYQVVKNFINTKYFKDNSVVPV